ncbi:MAG TPA: TetR/AcrR family transcriptional regulator [Candidatus Eremiobacteraceae bacterium]|nr:TetR/AcrR family transcriptional regulator [Candidatus Eremiobacteraceae bacterium]
MANRRQHIIEAAGDIVYRKGFAGTTVDDMLRAAGVGKGNFYHYFRSKDDLGIAIIDEIAKGLNGPAMDEIFSVAKAPLTRLTDYIEYVKRRRHADNCGEPLANLAAELGHVERFGDRVRRAYVVLLDRLESCVAEYALERGAAVDARMIARSMSMQIDGACLLFKVDRDNASFDAAMDAIVPSVETAVRAGAPQQPSPSPRTTAQR